MRKAVKIIGAIVLVPIILIILLAALFYFPPFQNWAVRQATAIASEKTGMEISIGYLRLSFPIYLAAHDVEVIRQNDSLPQQKDTIASLSQAIVDVQLLPLLRSQVEVDMVELNQLKFNTVDFVDAARVKGHAEKLLLKSHGIDLSKESVMLDEVLLDGADVKVQLCDSVPEDTTKSEYHWQIALQTLQVQNSRVALSMPGDSLRILSTINQVVAEDGHFDLFRGLYEVGEVTANLPELTYDKKFEPLTKGLDFNHLALNDISVGIDSLRYLAPDLYVKIRNVQAREKSGLELSRLNGVVSMDSTSLHVPRMNIATSCSDVALSADMDLNAFADVNPGQMTAKLKGQLGREDIMLFMNDLPERLRTSWPHFPLDVDCDIEGNLQSLRLNKCELDLPTAFHAKASGTFGNVTCIDDLLAQIDLDVTTYNLGFLTSSFLDSSLQKTIHIPNGIGLKGSLKADGSLYKADVRISQGGGWAKVKALCNTSAMTYKANIQANAMPVQKFLPGMNMSAFTGSVNIDGAGTDLFSPRMRLEADAQIERFAYSDFDLSGATAKAIIKNGVVSAKVNCVNKVLRGDISLDALMNTHDIKATVACSLDNADLYGMKLVRQPLSTSLCAHVDVESDLDDYYKVDGFVSDVVIRDSASTYRTQELMMDILTRRDTTWAKINSGDLHLDLTASGGYRSLMKVTSLLGEELSRQIERKYICQDSLKQVLPIGHLSLRSGKNNFVAHYAERLGYVYRDVNADFALSPTSGVNGYAQVDSLCMSGMQLDHVRLDVATDESGFKYNGLIKNEKNNPQYCFTAMFDGRLFETGSDVNVSLLDEPGRTILKLGLRAMLEQNGIRLKLSDTNTILGYRKFKANDANYFFLADDNRVSANMQLKSDDGTGIQIYTDDDNLDALQDITLGIHHLDLASIVSVLPYMPKIEGVMDGDFHAIQTSEELSVSSSLGVDGLVYEGCKMGNLGSEFVYIPREDGGHYVDGILMHNGDDIGTIKGTYTPGENQNTLDAQVDLARLPLNLVNGFIPDQIIGLRGYGDGQLDIHGPLSNLDVEGEVDLDSAFLVSTPYGVELSFDDRPVKIRNSRLLLENFNMYAHNKQPLVLNGHIDFSNTDKMTMNMRMKASNFLLIDSKENRKSEAFGKAFVNFDAMATGPLAAIQMRGKLDVLGSTDLTYIMRDTPLSTDNRLDELVKFTDFNSSVEESIVRPTLEGLSVDLGINIDQGARVFCALNAVKSNYVDIVGGGDLRFTMKGDDMRMTGRYTISSGEMKYSLPVIPLQTFNIDDGSYVEFMGDVMNPKLNITATETIKTNVNEEGVSRNVQFQTGVVITQTLNDMGLEFIIDAPEDWTIHSNLQTMSKEERGKIAVSMLTTGMYLSSTNTSSMSTNSAFNSFLQSEINSITGNALRTLDLSFGLDNSTDATGQLHTDYSFKFAKRFWDNRVRLVVGGKVSSGTSQTQSLFDNLALEYRLGQSANTNLKVFYERQVYDYLEGYVGQYGVGIVWKRKLQRLDDIFSVFRRKTTTPSLVPPDSIKVEKGGLE